MKNAVSADTNGIIRVSGELTFVTAPTLLPKSQEWFSGAAKTFTLDCSDVTKLDSAGVALLVEWMKRAKANSRPLRVTNLPKQARDLLRITGLDSVFI